MSDNRFVVVLAAGKGTRMRSEMAKVLHRVCSVPMIELVLNAVASLRPLKTVVVLGHQKEEVERLISGGKLDIALQREQKGTAHAVLAASGHLAGLEGDTLIICGDTPLVRPQTLQEMFDFHQRERATLTVLTVRPPDPFGYGRVVMDEEGGLVRIVEEKDASDEEKKIGLVNSGVYCVDNRFLFDAIGQVGSDNSQGEMYLTDIVEIAVKGGKRVKSWYCSDHEELLGVNSPDELRQAERIMIRRQSA